MGEGKGRGLLAEALQLVSACRPWVEPLPDHGGNHRKWFFYPLYLCPETPSSCDLHRSELPLQAPPPSPPSPPSGADGAVKAVLVAVPKEVFGVSMKEVLCNVMVTMASCIG